MSKVVEYTADEVLQMLRARAEALGSQSSLADEFCVTRAFISDVLSRRRGLSMAILEPLGLVAATEKVTRYFQIARKP